MRQKRADPSYLLCNSLIERVHHSAWFLGLSEAERLYYAVVLLRNEINNGGFHQYFFNSSGSYFSYAEEGLVAIGATRTLELLQQAKGIIFQRCRYRYRRRKRGASTLPYNLALGVRSGATSWTNWTNFYADADKLAARLETFAQNHGLIPTTQEKDL